MTEKASYPYPLYVKTRAEGWLWAPIKDGQIRLAIDISNEEDIIADLNQALVGAEK